MTLLNDIEYALYDDLTDLTDLISIHVKDGEVYKELNVWPIVEDTCVDVTR
jgi:hypothetical protein